MTHTRVVGRSRFPIVFVACGTVAIVAMSGGALALGLRDRSPSRPPRTWIVRDGTIRSFFTTQVADSDVFRCAGVRGGVVKPPRGQGSESSTGVVVETGWNGVVTVTCGPLPPFDVEEGPSAGTS
jgi:hypothetical protein